jgi:transcriptional regulator with XRE-family HTH domain
MALTPEQLKRLRRDRAANRLRRARELSGLTQVQLSAQTGLTQSVISDLERKRYAGTSVETAQKLAATFGCAIEDLFPAPQAVA